MALIDNRTQLQDSEAHADVAGDSSADPQATTSETGLLIQGANSMSFQVTNAYEYVTYDQDLNGATFNLDLSDSTVYICIKDNLNDTFANLGATLVLVDTADGTSTTVIGYSAGGSDATGLTYRRQYSSFKLDVSEPVATPGTDAVDYYTFAGTEANLDQTIIKQVGYGSQHLAKAVGTTANAWFDGIYYITNGSYAATINAGTVGTPIDMTSVVSSDETVGAAMFSNPKGSEFDFFAPTEWGNAATVADVYFTGSDEQWFWMGDNGGGRPVGIGNFPFRIVGNATDTIDIKWSNLVIINIGGRADFIAGDINVDIMQFDNVTFTNLGAITFPVLDTGNKFANNCSFNNCDQVVPSTTVIDSPTFNGTTDANGALLVAASTDGIDSASFVSDGTGHAIYITTTGTYDFDLWTFSGYGADATTDSVVYNNSGGAVTINILNGGDTPTVRNGAGASTTINNSVTVLVQGVTEGAAVKVIEVGSPQTIILEVLADSNGEASTSINFTGDLPVVTRVRSSGLPTAAIQDDNGAFTDETTAANSAVAADMNLLPATPVVNEDRYLFGHAEKFNNMKIGINTAGTGGFTITWQYWNGATWANLAGVIDGTSSFSVTGTNYISFTLPGDWATTTINTTQGPYYYIRAAYTAGTVTIVPLGTRCSLDVNKYLPFVQNGTVTTDGLTVTASWNRDTIATF